MLASGRPGSPARRHTDDPEECRMVMRHRRLLATACATLTAGLAASLTACSSGAAQPSDMITVSSNQCGGNWSVAGPGWHTIQINNQGTSGAEIALGDPANGAVYAEREHRG